MCSWRLLFYIYSCARVDLSDSHATIVVLRWSSVQSARFRFCTSLMDWTCCTCVGVSVRSILFRPLCAACIFWECKKCQLYRSSCINVISMVKAICAHVIWCWQARSLCDSTCSLMACGDKEREGDCSGRLLRVQAMLVSICFDIFILLGAF